MITKKGGGVIKAKPGNKKIIKGIGVKKQIKNTETEHNPKPVDSSQSNTQDIIRETQTNSSDQAQPKTTEQSNILVKEQSNPPQQIHLPAISYLPGAISSFFDIDKLDLDEYSFSDSPIIDFNGINRLTNAHSIFITNALFTSFKNSTILPKLKKCSFSGSPISIRKHYRLMILFAFGNQIEEIDKIPVSEQEKKIFDKFDTDSQKIISNYIQKGGIVMRDFNNDLLLEIKRKQIQPPEIGVPVGQSPTSVSSFTSFLSKTDLCEYININHIPSKSVEHQKEQRELLVNIEHDLFKDLLPRQSKLTTICNQDEINQVETEAFSIIKTCFDQIISELHSKSEMIEKVNSINNFSSFSAPVLVRINECISSINNLSVSLSNKSFDSLSQTVSHSFISKKRQNCYSMIESSLLKYINTLSDQIIQFKQALNPDISFKKHFPISGSPNRSFFAIYPPVQKVEEKSNESSQYYQNIEPQIQQVFQIIQKAKIYLTLISKCPLLTYFCQLHQLCSESYGVFSNISVDQSHSKSHNLIMNMFTQLLDFNKSVIDNYENIGKLHSYLPNYSEIESRILAAIGESKSYLKRFQNEKIDQYRRKLAEFDCDGSEFKEKWKEITNKIEAALKFIVDTFEWTDESGISSFLMNDIGVMGDEYLVMRTNECEDRSTYQNELDALLLEEEAKDAEIAKLLAQCAEFGIDI